VNKPFDRPFNKKPRFQQKINTKHKFLENKGGLRGPNYKKNAVAMDTFRLSVLIL
jgi:hypothetical protein